MTAGVVPSATQAAPAPVKEAGTTSVATTAAKEATGFAVQLGPEQRIVGPTDQGDNPFFSEVRNGKLYAYFGTSRTIEWRSRGNARISKPRVILDRGPAGRFDECGAWMQGSFQKLTRRHWIAFYHAEGKGPGEEKCDHYGDTTVWRMALAETKDGGQTWRRPDAPGNVVVTGVGATATSGMTNAGTGRVVKIGDYYYMFFKTAHGTRPGPAGIHIARAKVGAGVNGLPGKFFKYYCHPKTVFKDAYCAWDEPGVGGHSTPIGGLSEKGRYIVWNSALSRWIAFDASGKRGFKVYASEVGSGATTLERQQSALFDAAGLPVRWAGWEDVYPLVSSETDKYVDQWGGSTRNARSKQLYAYPSVGGLEGQSGTTGSSFYVYYVKLFPGDNFTKRYLFRRKVTVTQSPALNRVELTTYKNSKGQRTSSTEAPKSRAFKRQGPTGYLLSHSGEEGWKQVFDCTRKADHALFVNKCKIGWKANRRVGFIHPTATSTATVPVFRCVAKGSHYASNRRDCNGGRREGRLGFAMGSL